MKSVSLFFKPLGFKLNPFLMICLNDVSIPIETSCRCLGHIITNNVSDNENIRRKLRCFMDGQTCCYVPLELVRMM